MRNCFICIRPSLKLSNLISFSIFYLRFFIDTHNKFRRERTYFFKQIILYLLKICQREKKNNWREWSQCIIFIQKESHNFSFLLIIYDNFCLWLFCPKWITYTQSKPKINKQSDTLVMVGLALSIHQNEIFFRIYSNWQWFTRFCSDFSFFSRQNCLIFS